jgi:hypothetical protein
MLLLKTQLSGETKGLRGLSELLLETKSYKGTYWKQKVTKGLFGGVGDPGG